MVAIISWLFAVWTSYVFLLSLYYKFDETALEPIHIFSTIGAWISTTPLGSSIGELFIAYGQYLIGFSELIVSIVLLSPIVLIRYRAKLHRIGAIMASIVMAGAVFFHIITPLGWVPTWCSNGVIYAVNNSCNGGEVFTDAGLANAALSILILGIVVAFIND